MHKQSVKPPTTLTKACDRDIVYDLSPCQVKYCVLGLEGEDGGMGHLGWVFNDEAILMITLHWLIDQVVEIGLGDLTDVEKSFLPIHHQQTPLFVNLWVAVGEQNTALVTSFGI